MLTTIDQVAAMPLAAGVLTAARVPWVNGMLQAADAHIKKFLKRDIELTSYVEYYDGNSQRDLPLRQYPIWQGLTTIASSSGGQPLPQSTINVASTSGFCPGTGAIPNVVSPMLAIQTGPSTWTSVGYTGTTATSFTGCSGGAGTLIIGNSVYSPVVWQDTNGFYGQLAGGYADKTILSPGTTFSTLPGIGGRGGSGVLRAVGIAGAAGYFNWFPGIDTGVRSKLAASRHAYWPLSEGSIKVAYSAGFYPVPADLSSACATIVAYMIRNMPSGAPLTRESLGAYSYSVLTSKNPDCPELGSAQTTLALYRESAW